MTKILLTHFFLSLLILLSLCIMGCGYYQRQHSPTLCLNYPDASYDPWQGSLSKESPAIIHNQGSIYHDPSFAVVINETSNFQIGVTLDDDGPFEIDRGQVGRFFLKNNIIGKHILAAKAYVLTKYSGKRQVGQERKITFLITGVARNSPVGPAGWYYVFRDSDFNLAHPYGEAKELTQRPRTQPRALEPTKMTIDMGIDKLARQVTQSLAPEKRPKVAVVDLLGPNNDHTELGSFISEKLISRLFTSGRFEKVVERRLLRDLLLQQGIETKRYLDQDAVRSICEKIGVDAIVMGSITDCGSKVDVNIRLVNTNGEIMSVAGAQIDKDQVPGILQGVKEATLTVAINPAGVEASVAVGDRVLKSINGVAVFGNLPQGNRSIIVAAKGYEIVQESVYLTGDRGIIIHITPRKITLTVRITPPEGEILFDGENKGKASHGVMVLGDVLSGKHTILARAEGYLPETREIEAYENKVISIELLSDSLIKIGNLKQDKPRPLRDPIVIEVINLDYADAEYLASVLAPLLSKEGQVLAYRPTNSLIVKDRASLVKRLVKIIKGNPDL